MTKLTAWKNAAVVLMVCAATAIVSHAQTFRYVSFEGTDGAYPRGGLIQGIDGNLYGTTDGGGNANDACRFGCGTVFRITPRGTLTTLYSFCAQANCADGADPLGLAQGTDGNFYGTTGIGGANNGGGDPDSYSGCGTVFKLTPAGTLTTIYNFCSQASCTDGGLPGAPLIQATDGNFYGSTLASGVSFDDYGTIFRITPSGTLTTLYNFCPRGNCDYYGYDGPVAALVQATDGNFYGTTFESGGFNGFGPGTVFRITPSGMLTTLYTFCSQNNCYDGNNPEAALAQATDGNFYATTAFGGIFDDTCSGGDGEGCGTVFKITPRGKLITLYRFCSQTNCADGGLPFAGLVQGTDGDFYGTASLGGYQGCYGGCGTIFKITPSGTLTTLHTFESVDGADPLSGLLQATNGIFYGTTNEGGLLQGNCVNGQFIGCGTVFSLDTGLGPFVTFVRAAGKVGQTGPILGQGFTGTTSVSFNGIPASFTVVSETFLKARVPAGATTGYVTVTTPSGTLTSNVPFHVIP